MWYVVVCVCVYVCFGFNLIVLLANIVNENQILPISRIVAFSAAGSGEVLL